MLTSSFQELVLINLQLLSSQSALAHAALQRSHSAADAVDLNIAELGLSVSVPSTFRPLNVEMLKFGSGFGHWDPSPLLVYEPRVLGR